MQSVAFTPATAIAAVFAATGQDLGMVGTSSMAHGTGRRVEGGLHCSIRLPGLEVGDGRRRDDAPLRARLARADGLRGPRQGLSLRPDRRRGDARAEISASAAMATAGSENFFRAHHERGGLR